MGRLSDAAEQVRQRDAEHQPPGIPPSRSEVLEFGADGVATGTIHAPLDELGGDPEPRKVLAHFVRHQLGADAALFELLHVGKMTIQTSGENGVERVWFKDVKVRWRSIEQAEASEALKAKLEQVRKRRPRKQPAAPAHDLERTLVVCLSDEQWGKGEGGGSDLLSERAEWRIEAVERRQAELNKMRRPATRLLALGTGDTTEGCGGNPNYPTQDFTVDGREADQVEMATDTLEASFDRWAGSFHELWSTTVSSNHDAKRLGKDYPTGRADCRAFTIWRNLKRMYRRDDRYGHLRLWLPDDPDVAHLDLHGVGLAAIHGDLVKGGGNTPQAKMQAWWQGQAWGRQPAGRADVLVTAHYHHYWQVTQGGRLADPDGHADERRIIDRQLFGCPAMDGGSQWWTDRTGLWSAPGVLTFVVDAYGVSDVAVLTPPAELVGADAARRTAA